jgi:hypothetical protein
MRAHPALVLNADFQPLNYFPLSTMDSSAHAGRTDIASAHRCQADVSAELSARELARLSPLGQRDRELSVT